MYKKILVPLDGSAIAEGVLPYVRTFAASLNIPVHLLQVIDPDTLIASRTGELGLSHNISTAEREHNGDYLKKMAAALPDPAAASFSVRIGKPAEVIIEVATPERETLIAMATHGRSGARRWLLGSVAEKVLNGAESDVLLIRAEQIENGKATGQVKRLVVPLDGSELAERVLPRAVELAKKMHLDMLLLRAYLMPGVAYPTGAYAPDWKLLDEEQKEIVSEYLERKIKELRDAGLERVFFTVQEGSAAEKIIDVARENPESLIAMSPHGVGGVGRWVFGSITLRVIRHAETAVLVIRAKTDEAEESSELKGWKLYG